MYDNDQMIITDILGKVTCLQVFGGLLVFIGLLLLCIGLTLDPEIFSFAGLVSIICFILTGSLLLLTRRIHLLDRSTLTVCTQLGYRLPFRGVRRLPIEFSNRSIKGFKRVSVWQESTYSYDPHSGIGGAGKIYRVGFGQDRNGIWIKSFYSRAPANKLAKEIERFLYPDQQRHNN